MTSPPFFFHHVLHDLVTDMNMPSFCRSDAFQWHFLLINKEDLETILRAAIFVNEADNQVRAAHEILGYAPIQRSFADPKYVIRANDPRLQRITVVKHGFLIPEGSPVLEGIPLAGSSSSHQTPEAESDSGCPKKDSVRLTRLVHPRIPLVTWVTPTFPRQISC